MKIERSSTRGRAPLLVALPVACASIALSGCMSSPTYGTDKTANQQLMEDLSSIMAIGPGAGGRRNAEIAYNTRPELVRPASLEVLPEPQQQVTAANHPDWPESPEQRRARLREEATANHEDPNYRGPISSTGYGQVRNADELANARSSANSSLTDAQRADMEKRLRERNQGDPNTRRYLSEPPTSYRAPAETATAGDMGEDEWRKERRQKRAAGKSSWRDLVPWL